LVRLGTFRKETGLLGRSGNDRLILSKNSTSSAAGACSYRRRSIFEGAV
ncbi:keywimysin-related RiPP, partial [Streptomyces bottropensis]